MLESAGPHMHSLLNTKAKSSDAGSLYGLLSIMLLHILLVVQIYK